MVQSVCDRLPCGRELPNIPSAIPPPDRSPFQEPDSTASNPSRRHDQNPRSRVAVRQTEKNTTSTTSATEGCKPQRSRKRRAQHASNKKQKSIKDAPSRRLRHEMLVLGLVLLYTMANLFSWTVTCILCYKPLEFATYDDRTGTYTRKQYEDNDWWTRIVRTTNAIVAVTTVPVTSAVCAKAAVIYCQTPSGTRRPGLTLRQTLALADKGWSNVSVLSRLLRP